MSDSEITLPEHEAHSEARAAAVIAEVHHQQKEAKIMSEHDKVEVKNIFEPGKHGGGEGGAPWASILPALMAERGGNGFGGAGGFGAGLVGGVLGGLLFGGRGRGGLFGGGDDCGGGGNGAETRLNTTINDTAILTTLGDIKAAIPLAQVQTENVILTQTNQITQLAAAAQLANQAGFANVKDTVQGVGALTLQGINNVNQNVLTTGCSIERAIANDGEKTRALVTSIFQSQQSDKILAQNAEIVELREETRRAADSARHAADVNALRSTIEINNTSSASQQQGQLQAQQQAQFQAIGTALGQISAVLGTVVQVAHATNNNVIAGNTGAVTTGAQTSTASPTNVNA